MHMLHGQSPVDFLFAQADTNKDGKLTKDEVANFVWSHLTKADANHDNSVTKDELKAFARQRFEAMRTEHREKAHKAHEGAQTVKAGRKTCGGETENRSETRCESRGDTGVENPGQTGVKSRGQTGIKGEFQADGKGCRVGASERSQGRDVGDVRISGVGFVRGTPSPYV